jgi:hypothetical protein
VTRNPAIGQSEVRAGLVEQFAGPLGRPFPAGADLPEIAATCAVCRTT